MNQLRFIAIIIAFTIIASIPMLNFQDSLSVGDHGRDLYASVAVYRGELPFKDFWWVYGPLMPYYYGIFDLILGNKITSVLLGKLILKIACAVCFFFGARIIMPVWISIIAACWFINAMPDFFFTYNHLGGILLTILTLGFGLNFLRNNNLRHAWLALLSIGVLGLIKVNFALSAGSAIGFAFILNWITHQPSRQNAFNQQHLKFYAASLLGLPLLWLGIYLFFLQGLSIAEIRQCLPYLGGDQPFNYPPSYTIPYYLTQHWLTLTHQWQGFINLLNASNQQPQLWSNSGFLFFLSASILNLLLHPIWHVSTITSFISQSLNNNNEERRLFWITTAFLLMFFILNFHEFVVSGVWYRSYWTYPILVIFHFYMIATALRLAHLAVKIIVNVILMSLLIISVIVPYQTLPARKTPAQFINDPKGQIYVGNEPGWVDTVNTASKFLNSNLKPGEQFFAMPYDCLYYYLTGTKTPTRQLIFFDHIKITPEQEKSIINELEKNHTAYVLISNRIAANETGLGIFGKTYCPLIYQYVMQNFTPVFKYGGNWQAEPGWANNHGVIILKRKY